MKYFLAFFGLIAAIGILTLMFNFTFKGVPEQLEISGESLTQYTVKNNCSDPNDISVSDYDFKVKIEKTTDPEFESFVSRKEGFRIVIPTVPKDDKQYHPRTKEGVASVHRTPEGQALTAVVLQKLKKCASLNMSSSLSLEEVDAYFGKDIFSNDQKLLNDVYSKGFQRWGLRVLSAKYLVKKYTAEFNGQRYIGSVAEYITNDGPSYVYQVVTVKNDVMVLYAMIAGQVDLDHKYILKSLIEAQDL